MDATTPTVSTYAAETLSSAATTTGSGNALAGTFYDVVDAGTNLDIQTEIGVGVSDTNQLFVRYDLSNAVWSAGTAPNLVYTGGAGITFSVAQGGGLGDSFVIFSITAVGDLATDDLLTFEIGGLGIASSGSSNVSYAAYETLTAAINQGQSLYSNSVASYVAAAPGAAATFDANTNTAEVTTDFKEFTGALSATLANIGDLTYAAVTGVFDATTGSQVDVANVADEAATTVALAGDFSFGSWFLSANTNCSTTDVDLTATIPEEGTSAEADLIEFGTNGFTNLCLEVDGVDDVINEGSYTASATVAPAAAGAVVSPAPISGTVGTIVRNGTTVQAPYITTFADYNQRIILVNRGNAEAPYMSSFTPEEGVTVTAGAEAMGTLAPGETKVIRAADFVTIEGGTRTAATIVIVAPPANIDAATTQVNLADGGTDTVVLF
jgi:hypothetical protein